MIWLILSTKLTNLTQKYIGYKLLRYNSVSLYIFLILSHNFASSFNIVTKFTGGRTLIEYEIQLEDLQFESLQNVSRANVIFVFRRRMEFHVTNTFLQVQSPSLIVIILILILWFTDEIRNLTESLSLIL